MQVVRDALRSADLPYGGVATIGNYDGIHRGQQAVLSKVVERGRALGVQSIAISFEPHPLSVLRPESAPLLLTPGEQREKLLAESGIDILLLVQFSQDFARTPAERFATDFLSRKLSIAELFVGSGFTFGSQRDGDVRLLERLGAELGFVVQGVDEVLHQGKVVSSTRIRRAVVEGEVELAVELLGRPYGLQGSISRGDRMGARLGWPTINLQSDNELLPGDGVYTGRVFFPSIPATFDCVTNVGTRPTVYENYQHVVESHILGFDSDVYGEEVEIRFYKRLREEKIFSNVMELSAQIARDVEATREYFASRKRLLECGV